MPGTLYVGLAVSSQRTTFATGVFSQVTVRASAADGSTAPTLTIVNPVDGATLPANQPVTISSAVSGTAFIVRVDFLADGAFLGSATAAPYSLTWNCNCPGTQHVLSSVAVTSAGTAVYAQSVRFAVSATSTPPPPSSPPSSPPDPIGSSVLEPPWQQQAIGLVTVPGEVTENGGVVAVMTAGSIGGAADQFPFVYQSLDGDGEIVARVEGLGAIDPWSHAGVMIRNGLTPSSFAVFAGLTGGNGWVVERRDGSTSGLMATTSLPGAAGPGWVRLVRESNRLSAFQSADGVNWTLVSTPLEIPGTMYVGLAVSSQRSTLATGVFTNVMVRGLADVPTVPTLAIVNPANGATLPADQPVTISATANDPNHVLSSVTFLINGLAVGTVSTAPYSITQRLSSGTYKITARGASAAGESFLSGEVTATVTESPGTSPASISLTAPTANAAYTAPATISMAATVTTSNTSVNRVDFYGDGLLLGSDSTSPYTFTWSNVSAGSHAVSAAAVLATGGSVSAQAVSVSVGTPTSSSATLFFSPSSDESTTVDYYTFELYLQGGAMPMSSKHLGKPAAVNGEITVDVSDLVNAVASGTYFGVVTAHGPGGTTSSQPSPSFTK